MIISISEVLPLPHGPVTPRTKPSSHSAVEIWLAIARAKGARCRRSLSAVVIGASS